MTMLHLVPQEISAYQNGHLRGCVLQPHRTMKVVLYVGLNLFQGPRRKGDNERDRGKPCLCILLRGISLTMHQNLNRQHPRDVNINKARSLSSRNHRMEGTDRKMDN